MNFQKGDRVLSTGGGRGSGKRFEGKEGILDRCYAPDTRDEHWAINFGGGRVWHIYTTDFVLAKPPEPEEYESWFV